MLELIVLFPLIAAILTVFLDKNPRLAELIACAGALGAVIAALFSISIFINSGSAISDFSNLLRMDALSAFLVGITSVVSLLVFIYSVGYMRHEVEEKIIKEERLGRFYAQLCLFLAAMLCGLLASNPIHVWAAVELTTLSSVFLISFYNTKTSVEAAWKYFTINSVGFTLAFIGILVLFYAFSQANLGMPIYGTPFDITKLNPVYLKLAFAFVLVGYGTKVGLVPLHVWLPDAHSQAPTPVSALLSGLILNIAFYGILRVYGIVLLSPAIAGFASGLFILFGVLSLVVGSLRLFAQDNLKRLLAYSSVENMGIIVLATGIGGPIAVFAALFHMLAHSLAKPLAFLLGGIVTNAYGTKNISEIKGAANAVPIFGILFLLTILGVAGSIPFGTFFSEIALLGGALLKGQYIVTLFVIVFTIIAFASFLYKVSGMVFGNKPEKMPKHVEVSPYMSFAVIVLLLLAIGLALFPPAQVLNLIKGAGSLIGGV